MFGVAVGLIVAVLAYRWITDPMPRAERRHEEAAIASARAHIERIVAADVEFVDPLAANRSVGRAYVYRDGGGWQVSGHYRRGEDDGWHPYLITLDAEHALLHVKVGDPALAADASIDPQLEYVP